MCEIDFEYLITNIFYIELRKHKVLQHKYPSLALSLDNSCCVVLVYISVFTANNQS